MVKACSQYVDLNATLAAAGGGDAILINTDTTLATSAIISSTMQLQWEGNSRISIAAGQILTVRSSPNDWPLRQLFIGAGATPGVSFAGNIGIEWVSPVWWGMNTPDCSNALNYSSAALQGGSIRGGTVKLPRGIFYAANILMAPGVTWEGSGPGGTSYEGTTIKQLANSNADVFVSHSIHAPNKSYLHTSRVRNLRILGDPITNTLGNGIHVSCATGELNTIEDVLVAGMPENGILYSGNGTNVRGSHLALHGNGKSGLCVSTTGATAGLQLCHFDDISGDNNKESLVYYKPPGTSAAIAYFSKIKSETSAVDKQKDIIILDNLNGTPVHIDNVVALVNAGSTLNSFVRNLATSSARIYGKGWRAEGAGTITSLVQDQNAGTTLPYLTNENVFHFTWAGGVPYDIDKGFRFIRNLFNGGVAVVTSSTYTMSVADENRLLVFDRPGPIAVTVPSPVTSGFTNGAIFPVMNIGAGLVTLTPNNATINKAATLALSTDQGAQIVSDGTNYYYWR